MPSISISAIIAKPISPKQLQAYFQTPTPSDNNPFSKMIAKYQMMNIINNTPERNLRKLFEFSILNHLNIRYLLRLHEIAPSPLTFLVVLLCNVIFLLCSFGPYQDQIMQSLAVIRYKIFQGEYYRLVTACFTHSFW
jgi:membrane associated rhomboid family serine protease